jgi:hypothetical protein
MSANGSWAATAHQLRKHDEWRQVGPPAEQIGGDAARMGRLNAAGESPAGLQHLPASVVHGGAVVAARPDERKFVGDFRVLWQQFRDLEGVGLRADWLERPTDLGGRIGLHVPEVELAGPPEVEDHDAGPLLVAGADLSLAGRPHVLRQGEPDGGQGSHMQEIAAGGSASAEQGPLTRTGGMKLKHRRLLALRGARGRSPWRFQCLS